MLVCSRRQAVVVTWFLLWLLIKGHLFSSEAAIANTQSGCFLAAYIHFLHSGGSRKVKVSGSWL